MKAVAVVVVRLNSSRLPGKQLLDLAGRPLIEHIFKRLDAVPEISAGILATTADAYNQPLIEWAQNTGREVFAFEGEVFDVMGRIDAVVKQTAADIVVTISGDSPLVEPSTLNRMVKAIKQQPEYDQVSLKPYQEYGQCMHEGFGVFSRRYWNAMNVASIHSYERENIGSIDPERQPPKRTLFVDDEEIFYRIDHRISVDTVSDYYFMREVYERWYESHPETEIVSLSWVVEQLAQDPQLVSMNSYVQQRQVGERLANVLLVTESGPGVGLGHLRRSTVVARALQDYAKAGVRLMVLGEQPGMPWANLLPTLWLQQRQELIEYLGSETDQHNVIILDLKGDELWLQQLRPVLEGLQSRGIYTVAIDDMAELQRSLDLLWFPSFYLDEAVKSRLPEEKTVYGWGSYLLPPEFLQQHQGERGSEHILVSLGGGDVDHLGDRLPQLLSRVVPEHCTIHWIQGPYAPPPTVTGSDEGPAWKIHQSPGDLLKIYQRCDVALISYGVSLFEVMGQAIPVVALRTSAGPAGSEWQAFRDEEVAWPAESPEEGVEQLLELLNNPQKFNPLAQKAREKMEDGGARKLAFRIAEMVRSAAP